MRPRKPDGLCEAQLRHLKAALLLQISTTPPELAAAYEGALNAVPARRLASGKPGAHVGTDSIATSRTLSHQRNISTRPGNNADSFHSETATLTRTDTHGPRWKTLPCAYTSIPETGGAKAIVSPPHPPATTSLLLAKPSAQRQPRAPGTD